MARSVYLVKWKFIHIFDVIGILVGRLFLRE